MENEWDIFKAIRGCLLLGIYAKQLDIHQFNKELILHPFEPILAIGNPRSLEVRYWYLSWFEDITGDDLLIIKEQVTPEPLEFESINAPYQKHSIMASSFFVQHNVINKVCVYGIDDEYNQVITSIILELEESYLSIQAGAVIEARLTEKKPNDFGTLIFTT
jgi:hypothetical protein